jgi:hypothetical protein
MAPLLLLLWAPAGCRFDDSGQVPGVGVPAGGSGGAGGAGGAGTVAGRGGAAAATGGAGGPGTGGGAGSAAGAGGAGTGAAGAGAAGAGGTGTAGTAGMPGPGVDATALDTPRAPPPVDTGPPPPPVDAAPPPPVDAPPPPMAPPPVAHWKFDESAGGTAADATASGNTGTLAGGAMFVSPGCPQLKAPNPGALALDGVDGEVVAGTSRVPAPNAPKTISLWYRAPAAGTGSRAFLSLTNRAASCGVHVGTKAGLLAAWKWGGDLLVSRPSPPGNAWHHVLYTFDGVGHTLRLDGGAPEFSNLPPQVCALGSVVIGNYEGGGNHFQGMLDDVRIYARVVTEVEARALADGREPGQ